MAKLAHTKAKRTTQEQDDDPVLSRLDVLISLLLPRMAKYAGEKSELQRKILSLCDYEHSSDEISKATKKTPNHVIKELSLLRSRGLVKTMKRDGRLVYVRL
jgi:DNA-binding transcriptional ArsR family regulator